MKELSTSRLLLRAWAQNDARFLLSLESLPETVRYLGAQARVMQSLQQAEESIRRRRAVQAEGMGIWAITARYSGELLGNLLCKPVDGHFKGTEQVIEIGWHLHPKFQGNGYATEAAQAVIDYAQSSGLTALNALVDPANSASVSVCHRLGFIQVGITDEYYGQPMVHFRKILRTSTVTSED